MATKLVDEVFCRFSMPEQLHSDQGKQFESKVIEEICKLLHIRKSRTTPYHPQSDGLVERFNRTLLSMLACCVEKHPFQWEEQLRKVCFAYNTSVHSTTGYTPFYLMFGRQARLPVDLYNIPMPKAAAEVSEYASQLHQRFTSAYDSVRATMNTKQLRQKEQYDSRVHGKSLVPGDLVWLFNPALPRGQARKFHRPWVGPYRILDKISVANYRIQHVFNNKRTVVHFNRLKRCPPGIRLPHPCRTSHSPPSSQPLPGERLDLLDGDDPTPSPAPPRWYPSHLRQPPERLGDYIPH